MNFARITSIVDSLTALAAAFTVTTPQVMAQPCSPELLSAVKNGDSFGIRAALDAGASVRCTDENGESVLHLLVTHTGARYDNES
jgi:hypothetical protein